MYQFHSETGAALDGGGPVSRIHVTDLPKTQDMSHTSPGSIRVELSCLLQSKSYANIEHSQRLGRLGPSS